MATLLLLKSMLFANAFQKSKSKKKKIKKIHKIKVQIKMCRICNQERGVIAIFNNSKQPNLPEEIHHFSGITLTQSDNLSNSMCQNCFDLLNGCILFREMCQRTNNMVRIAIKKEYDVEHEENLEENIEGNIRVKKNIGDNISMKNNIKDNISVKNNIEDNIRVKENIEDSFSIPSPSFSEDNLQLWACSTCGKDYNDMTSYNSHLSMCNARTSEVTRPPAEIIKKRFLCEICGQTAYSNASLIYHMRIHNNSFPFKCDQCAYRGRTQDLLKVHKRSHLIDKPFKCSLCSKSTTTSSNLDKHVRHIHSTNRPYKCTYCDKAFPFQHIMNKHIRDIHLRQGTVDCDICHKNFNTKKNLQGHLWKIHKIKSERHGRLPAYLQYQSKNQNDNNVDNCD